MKKKPEPPRVLTLVPSKSHAHKPSELVQIRGHEHLSLFARRAITLLWHNAHRQGIEPHKTYTIELSKLAASRHKGRAIISDTILTLMQTVIEMPTPDGGIRRVQVLGGNNMSDPKRPGGTLTYRFDPVLIEILNESQIWARIAILELTQLSTKYAVSLYEHVSQWINLENKSSQVFELDEFRALLGVEQDKYHTFGHLHDRVLQKCVEEVNEHASFLIQIEPRKTGKKVTHIRLSWQLKGARLQDEPVDNPAGPAQICDSSPPNL